MKPAARWSPAKASLLSDGDDPRMLCRITVGAISHGLGIRSSLPGDAGIVGEESNLVVPVPTSTEIIAAMFLATGGRADAPVFLLLDGLNAYQPSYTEYGDDERHRRAAGAEKWRNSVMPPKVSKAGATTRGPQWASPPRCRLIFLDVDGTVYLRSLLSYGT